MTIRFYGTFATLSLLTLGSTGLAKGEVYSQLDASGHFVSVQIARTRAGKIWEPSGAAASSALVLNPNGDLRGDGSPDLATSPVTGRPRVVWASRRGADYDIVSSEFDGAAWSTPVLVNTSNAVDDFAPRIVFHPNGSAIVSWWERGRTARVRLAYASPASGWIDAGVASAPWERAKDPALLQEGPVTVIAYRTPQGIQIKTFRFRSGSPIFGDGPTPFPRGDPPPDTDGD